MTQTGKDLYVLLGSNIHPEVNIPKAVSLLAKQYPVERVSQVWETPPIGAQGPCFLNAALLLITPLKPKALKELVLRPLELKLGRIRTADKYAPRTIDLDVVACGERTLDDDIWKYAHAAVPVAELLPGLRRQPFDATLFQVAKKLLGEASIRPRPDVTQRIARVAAVVQPVTAIP